jgi:hypothetical protein
MVEEGFVWAFLPIVGCVELLFSTSFFSCYFEMAEGFSGAFLLAVGGVELLFSASFFSCCFEMVEGFSTALLPGNGGVSPGAITEVLGPDVPAALFKYLRQIYH